ncbi:hypothetical protein BD309DRAFT_676064 [Dichomitus squalens]|nr:hypothetical protein BD309DRAFT_676064 [Dichomitus squalens]
MLAGSPTLDWFRSCVCIILAVLLSRILSPSSSIITRIISHDISARMRDALRTNWYYSRAVLVPQCLVSEASSQPSSVISHSHWVGDVR